MVIIARAAESVEERGLFAYSTFLTSLMGDADALLF